MYNRIRYLKWIIVIVSQHHIVEMSTTPWYYCNKILPCLKFMSYEGARGASGLLEEDGYQDGCSGPLIWSLALIIPSHNVTFYPHKYSNISNKHHLSSLAWSNIILSKSRTHTLGLTWHVYALSIHYINVGIAMAILVCYYLFFGPDRQSSVESSLSVT